jgi:glycogen operon protein
MNRTILPGKPYPLGASTSSAGTNFAVYSEHATSVSICFFDEAGKQVDCVQLPERTNFVWHGLIRNIGHGQLYGIRVEWLSLQRQQAHGRSLHARHRGRR